MASNAREVWEKREKERKAEQTKPYGPPKGRPWGRRRRAIFRQENPDLQQLEQVAVQYHFKNAAAAKSFHAELALIAASGANASDLQIAATALVQKYGHPVPIYRGLDRRVRRQWRSEAMREDRLNAAE